MAKGKLSNNIGGELPLLIGTLPTKPMHQDAADLPARDFLQPPQPSVPEAVGEWVYCSPEADPDAQTGPHSASPTVCSARAWRWTTRTRRCPTTRPNTYATPMSREHLRKGSATFRAYRINPGETKCHC